MQRVSSWVRVLNFELELLPYSIECSIRTGYYFEKIVVGYPLESMTIEFSLVPIQTCLRMNHNWFEGSDLVRVLDVHEFAFVLGVRRRGSPYLLAD